jgi:tetratricopeptide (TPR) repeat protein
VETKILVGERGAYRLTKMPERALQIPATARALLAARIDRLSPEDKRLLQAASVIGTDVPFDLLEAVTDEDAAELRGGLTRLQTAEFLYETRLFPELEYTFKHALTHEVAYDGLLHDRRRVLHERIVEAIERRHPERLGEHAERLAHHALKGELRGKAVYYLRQAGLKATQRSALTEAVVWLEQAQRVLRTLPETRSSLEQAFEICFDQRTAHLQLGQARQVLNCLLEARKVADKLNDDRRRARVGAFVTNIRSLLGQPEEALASGTDALAVAQSLGDSELSIFATSFLGQAHYFRGDYERVVELATESLETLPAGRDYEHAGTGALISVYDRCWLVASLAQLGRFTVAAERQAEAIRLAEPTQRALTIGLAHHGGSTLHLLKGEWAEARSLIERWIAVSRSGNVLLHLPYAVPSCAWALAQLGKATESEVHLREGEQILQASLAKGLVFHDVWGYQSLGRASVLLGRLDEASHFARQAIEHSAHSGCAAHAFQLLGEIATHPDRFDAATGEAHYNEALAIAEPRSMRPLVAHCHLGLGKLHRRMGNRGLAQEHFTIATAMYREMAMIYWLEQATAEARQLG